MWGTLRRVMWGLPLIVGCGGTGPNASVPTTGEAFGGVQCSAVRPPTEPDLMAWDPGARANLSRLRLAGLVAVRYQAKGCNVELELLSNCTGDGTYAFTPYPSRESKVAHDKKELFAQLPVGAVKLAGKVSGDKALRTDYMLAGTVSLPIGKTYSMSDLRGDCSRATHVVSLVYLGGFQLYAADRKVIDASASAFGVEGGGKADSAVEVLQKEGSAEACEEAQKSGTESTSCRVPLRIALIALEGTPKAPDTVATPKEAKPPPSPSAGPGAPTVLMVEEITIEGNEPPPKKPTAAPKTPPGTMIKIPGGDIKVWTND